MVGSVVSVVYGFVMGFGDRIKFIKEDDIRSSGVSFVENVVDVVFRFIELYVEKFGVFDGDEVGSIFVGNSFS